ncbi:MAG: hypothetical protein JWP27_2657 [Flaviaesturariibacter sp.]|nr:hypothetical protein [Flaviaesturariibacter sp.]
MQRIVRYLVARTYKPLLVRYLSRTRTYAYRGITVEVPPDVFHPGCFFSTRFLLRYLDRINVAGKTFLELGAGSGLISLAAYRRGATVMATDINPVAIEFLQRNADLNHASLVIRRADLFTGIEKQSFDIIAINPPYYRKDPTTHLDHAWYCGAGGTFFARLFAQIGPYLHAHSVVLMVLCDGCDLHMINGFAIENGLSMKLLHQRMNLVETNSIFQIMQG